MKYLVTRHEIRDVRSDDKARTMNELDREKANETETPQRRTESASRSYCRVGYEYRHSRRNWKRGVFIGLYSLDL